MIHRRSIRLSDEEQTKIVYCIKKVLLTEMTNEDNFQNNVDLTLLYNRLKEKPVTVKKTEVEKSQG